MKINKGDKFRFEVFTIFKTLSMYSFFILSVLLWGFLGSVFFVDNLEDLSYEQIQGSGEYFLFVVKKLWYFFLPLFFFSLAYVYFFLIKKISP